MLKVCLLVAWRTSGSHITRRDTQLSSDSIDGAGVIAADDGDGHVALVELGDDGVGVRAKTVGEAEGGGGLVVQCNADDGQAFVEEVLDLWKRVGEEPVAVATADLAAVEGADGPFDALACDGSRILNSGGLDGLLFEVGRDRDRDWVFVIGRQAESDR
jgi:hypothetical protein